jgi:hypothetical protein
MNVCEFVNFNLVECMAMSIWNNIAFSIWYQIKVTHSHSLSRVTDSNMELGLIIHAFILPSNSVSTYHSPPTSLIHSFIPKKSSISYLFTFSESGSGCFTRWILHLFGHCWIHSPWKTCSWCSSFWCNSSSLSLQWFVTSYL